MFRPGIPLPGTDAERGQPRPAPDARRPTAAERVRTLVESSVSATLNLPGARPPEPSPFGSGTPEARAVTPGGDVVVLVPASSPAAQPAMHAQGDEVTAVMEITDVAPVAVPGGRIRGRAWIAGWLTAVRTEERAACAELIAARHPDGPPPTDASWLLLRLEVGEAYVDDLWGAEAVEPDDFAAVAPDHLEPHEAELLQHLATAHQDEVDGLCRLLRAYRTGSGCAPVDGVRAVPLAVDRHGLRVRFCQPGGQGHVDVLFEFPEPVEGVAELRRAMRSLFESATG